MVNYECIRCGYKTDQKARMRLHLNKKIPCSPIKRDVNVLEHMDEILEIDESKQYLLDKIKKLEIENEAFKTEIKELKSNISTTTIHNTDNSTNFIFNFNLTPYNDPNLEKVDKYYLYAIKKVFMSIPTIIEKIHFNTEIPENHNICITNYRNKLAKVFNGTEWKTMDEDKLISELINTYEVLLEDWAEDDPEKMKYIEKYKNIKERDGEIEVMKSIKEDVKRLIYDKRDMIKLNRPVLRN